MIKLANHSRIRLLTTASAAVAAVALASAAHAATTTVDPNESSPNPLDTSVLVPPPTPTPVNPAHDTVSTVLDNMADITATISGALIDIDSDGPGSAATFTVDANTIRATAAGTNFANSIDLSVISNVDLNGDGAAALGFAINSPDGNDLDGGSSSDTQTADILASATANTLEVDYSDIDLDTGSLSASGNTIEANATANAGSNVIAGNLPDTYTSASTGFSNTTGEVLTTDPWLTAGGSLVASTMQINVTGDDDVDDQTPNSIPALIDDTPDAFAFVAGNTIDINLISGGDVTTEVTAVLDGNAIAANSQGNRSSSTIDVQDSAAFAGSAVVTNFQANFANPDPTLVAPGGTGTQGDPHSQIGATNFGNTIRGTIEGAAPGDDNVLDGSLTLTDNSITSSASGNESLGTGDVAGNRIVLDDAMSYLGPVDDSDDPPTPAPTANPGSDLVYNGGGIDTVAADLIIHSTQGNVGVSADNPLDIFAFTNGGLVTAEVQAIDASPVTVADNAVIATARGNAVSNAFATGENSALFNGSVALASQQVNYQADVAGTNLGGTISAAVTDANQATLGGSTVLVGRADEDQPGNLVATSATGNQASQDLHLEAGTTTLTTPSGTLLTGTTDDGGGDGGVRTNAGASLANLQSLYTGDIFSDQIGSQISLTADATTVSQSSLIAEVNSQESTAVGNSATQGFDVGGNSFSGTVGAASSQIVDESSAVAYNGNATVFIAANTISSSTLEATGTHQSAAGYGNRLSQTGVVDANTVTFPASGVGLSGGTSASLDQANVGAAANAALASLQSVDSGEVGGSLENANLSITVDATTGSTLSLVPTDDDDPIRNVQEAIAVANNADNQLTVTGTTVEDGIGIASVQNLDTQGAAPDAFNISAGNIGATMEISTGGLAVGASTLEIEGSRQSGLAYGNQVSNDLTVDGNTMSFPAAGVSLDGGPLADPNATANGAVAVASVQTVSGETAVYGSLTNASLGISTGAVTGSTLQITSTSIPNPDPLGPPLPGIANVQEAVAVGSSGANALALTGGTLGTGAGVVSVQTVEPNVVSATNSGSSIEISTLAVTGSTVEVSNNLERSVAYGGTVTNTLAVDGETIGVDESIDDTGLGVAYNFGPGYTLDTAGAVTAAYAVLNIQSLSTSVTADMISTGTIGIDIDGAVGDDGGAGEGATVINDGNTFVAAAYGTDATNAASLAHGNVTALPVTPEPDYAAVLNVTNVQQVSSTSSVVAQAAGDVSGDIVHTNIDGTVTASTVSTSGNTIQALANSNLADNSVSAKVNNIDTEADGFAGLFVGSATVVGSQAAAEASFSLNNVQAAAGTLTATLINDAESTSATVRTDITGDVVDSSVHSDFNVLSAGATANRADNLIDLSGNQLATSSALTNYQIDPTAISALIGIPGADEESGTTPGGSRGGYGSNQDGPEVTLSGDDITVPDDTVITFDGVDGFTPEEVAYLNGIPGFSGATEGGHTVTVAPDTYSQAALDALFGTVFVNEETGTLSLGGFDYPGLPFLTPGTANEGGVTVAIGGLVDPSTVTVDFNTTSGSVTGNSATNAVKVKATDLPDGNDHLFSSVTTDGLDTVAAGDHMLTNVQQVTGESGTEIQSEVYGTFAIDMLDDAQTVVDSTFEVDGNVQSSRAVANTANNSVTLDVGNTAAGAALASNQVSDATLDATSDLDIFAPVASSNSTVSMSDNQNLAVGVINNVSNTITVKATNSEFVTTENNVLLDVDDAGFDALAFGDHVLLNKQTATTTVDADAITNIYNDDFADPLTEGISAGTVLITGNSTVAEASANRAVNLADVSASSTLSASAGVVNFQQSSAAATASATTAAGATIATDTLPAVDGSTVTLGANTTSSLARGNAATNVLNYSGGAGYGDPTAFGAPGATFATGGPVDATVNARAAVLNVQSNSGDVTAKSLDASYVIALNTADASPTAILQDATVGVIGNTVSAAAYGNTANNVLTLNALNSGMPSAAVGSYQTNTAAVTARVTTVTYGVHGLGAISGSAASVNSNAITATAVGNNAVNAIAAN